MSATDAPKTVWIVFRLEYEGDIVESAHATKAGADAAFATLSRSHPTGCYYTECVEVLCP